MSAVCRPWRSKFPVELNNPLPNTEGPKLGPFEHRNARIDFVRLLHVERAEDDAYVFEVVIEEEHYALKVFKFYDHHSDMKELRDTLYAVSEKAFIAQFDPFYSECRAYGRIEECKKNGIVAVRAHGFMDLPAYMESCMKEPPFNATNWYRPHEEYNWPVKRRQPFRAIVKDLVEDKPNFRNLGQMREDLLALQNMGVHVQDIEKANYCDGKLVDFSMCWTMPHVFLTSRIRPKRYFVEEKLEVLSTFDRMLEAERYFTRANAMVDISHWDTDEDKGLVPSIEKDEVQEAFLSRLRPHIKKPDRLGFSKAA